jgi:hypothetical protein
MRKHKPSKVVPHAFVGPALDWAMQPVANWSRFNSCLAKSRKI